MMRTVRISEAVWDQIAARGKFGESIDDVLRRVFGLEAENSAPEEAKATSRRQMNGRSKNKATNRMSANVDMNKLTVEFASGDRKEFQLPNRNDKLEIRNTRDKACEFAESVGATLGQINAVKKALTEAGYHISR